MADNNINYIRASNLLLISLLIRLTNSFIYADNAQFPLVIASVMILAIIALLLRQGYVWCKYLLSTFIVIGLPNAVKNLTLLLKVELVAGLLSATATLLVAAAIIILFIPLSERSTSVEYKNNNDSLV